MASVFRGDEVYELFIYLVYDSTKFNVLSEPGKINFDVEIPYPSQYLPATDKTVSWYLDANYTYPAISTPVTADFILGMDIGNYYVFGGLNLYGRLEEKQVRFKEGKYEAAKFENGNSLQTPHQPGTIFMATLGSENAVKTNAHLIYDDGTYFLDVIPRMLPLMNGGTGTDLSVASTNAVFYKKSLTELGHIETANGAFYATSANGQPKFGTLPVKQGGTGKTSFTKYGVLYGNSTSKLAVTAAGGAGTIFVGSGSSAAPKFVAPIVAWDSGTTVGPTFKLTIDATNYTAVIPSASGSASGIVTTGAQTFAGVKTFSSGIIVNGSTSFNEKVNITGTDDAYYNSSSDNKTGALNVIGGITSSMNMRVDGGTIQFAKEGKI